MDKARLNKIKVAVIHYHLKPGGVSTVICNQVKALKDRVSWLIICGDPAGASLNAEIACIKDLDYDSRTCEPAPPETTAEAIRAAIYEKWPHGCDIIHVHNPLLKKNNRLLKILSLLQNMGFRLLCQVHDFAEDGRPFSFYEDQDYPSDCHYGVINSRDKEILISAGLKPHGVHLIRNTVSTLPSEDHPGIPRDIVLYPVRAIRRKNIGEAILLHLLLFQDKPLFFTLPPNSSPDIEAYNDWRKYTKNRGLPVLFNASCSYPFSGLVKSSAMLITTSITEGFGFAFLEAWTAKKLLWGRRLSGICTDFEKNGIDLSHLYDRLLVPLDFFDEESFSLSWRNAMTFALKRFGLPGGQNMVSGFYKSITKSGTIDFGFLSEPFQRQVLDRIITSPAARDRLLHLNKDGLLQDILRNAGRLILSNKKAVSHSYNSEKCGHELFEIYHKIIRTPVKHVLDKKKLAKAFVDPEKFSLLKWGSHEI